MEISEIKADDLTSLQSQGYTEHDLQLLAPTEVAALLAVPEDDDVTDVVDKHEAAAAEQDANNKEKPAADAAAASDEAKGEATTEAEAEADAPFVPQFKVDVPADAAEQIKMLQTEEKASFKQLMDGEIDADAYQVVRDRVEGAVDALKTQALTASIFEQANQQTAEQNARNEWSKAEANAFASFTAEGLDYKAKPSLLAAYNTNLKALGEDPKNDKRDAAWFLSEAHRLTKDDLGFKPAAAPTIKKGASNGANQVDLSQLPPTLRSVPVAATGAVNTDEFAYMRNLEGLELERAHAKLTNEQRDRWMAE